MNAMVGGYLRTLEDATLGYVYIQPGPGLVPVYVLGESDPLADNSCFFARWSASRVKRYTTSEAERTALLANFARDDGVAFYVPMTADSTTTEVFLEINSSPSDPLYQAHYYFPAGPEGELHPQKIAAFNVRAKPLPGTAPLMRVFYQTPTQCGWSHDELAVGQERFNRIYKQGDKLPLWSLSWTGITKPTTLVVEALDNGCPFQGHLSPTSLPFIDGQRGDGTHYPSAFCNHRRRP